jgi:hypothetical protein
MNDDKLYEDWKNRRRQQAPTPGFSDRVLVAIENSAAEMRHESTAQRLVQAVLSTRLGKIAVGTLAGAMCVLRLCHVIAIFVAQ